MNDRSGDLIERGSEARRFATINPLGNAGATTNRALAVEALIAIEYNGIGYAVMMGTPIDLEDFTFGFSLTVGLIRCADDLVSVDGHDSGNGRQKAVVWRAPIF